MIDGISTQQYTDSQSQILNEPMGRNDNRAYPSVQSFFKYTENPHTSIPTVRYCRIRYTNRKKKRNRKKTKVGHVENEGHKITSNILTTLEIVDKNLN